MIKTTNGEIHTVISLFQLEEYGSEFYPLGEYVMSYTWRKNRKWALSVHESCITEWACPD